MAETNKLRIALEEGIKKGYSVEELSDYLEGCLKDLRPKSQAKEVVEEVLEENLEQMITEIILEIGIPANIKGYRYVRFAIAAAVKDAEIINFVTKSLYPLTAREFKTTSSRVERAIRHAIEVAWERGDIAVLNSYFSYTMQNHREKPTNSEFIAVIADKLRLKLKKLS